MVSLVLDASSLILLAKIDLLEVIGTELELCITEKVKKEATKKGTKDAKLIERRIELGDIEVEEIDKKESETLADDFNLDEGEASAIVLYQRMDADILATDDGKAIDTCKILDVRYTTTLNLLIRAVEKEKLGRERGVAKLEKLDDYGWYKSRLIENARKSIRGDENE